MSSIKGHLNNEHIPTVVPNLSGIVNIRAVADWTLVLDNNGQLFGWGNNEYSQVNDRHRDLFFIGHYILSSKMLTPVYLVFSGE